MVRKALANKWWKVVAALMLVISLVGVSKAAQADGPGPGASPHYTANVVWDEGVVQKDGGVLYTGVADSYNTPEGVVSLPGEFSVELTMHDSMDEPVKYGSNSPDGGYNITRPFAGEPGCYPSPIDGSSGVAFLVVPPGAGWATMEIYHIGGGETLEFPKPYICAARFCYGQGVWGGWSHYIPYSFNLRGWGDPELAYISSMLCF